MKNGFFPALGTPLDDMGNLIVSSFKRQVEDQVAAGAAGLLVLGTMGIQAYIKDSEPVKIAKAAVEACKGKCPVFVGVMDNSAVRVKERIASMAGLGIDGVVATTPFYHPVPQEEILLFFRSIAAAPLPLYLYDLPSVTQCKIHAETAIELMAVPNICGIKTGDLAVARVLSRSKDRINPDFDILFSGLDVFDVAFGYGIEKNLDGIFSCTAAITSRMYAALVSGDKAAAADCLDDILRLRNLFLQVGVFSGFTYVMNRLGYEGRFAADYAKPLKADEPEKLDACLLQLHLI